MTKWLTAVFWSFVIILLVVKILINLGSIDWGPSKAEAQQEPPPQGFEYVRIYDARSSWHRLPENEGGRWVRRGPACLKTGIVVGDWKE